MGSLFFGLNIGRSAMLANQAGLDIAGHNLANVQTEGYSRQRASLNQGLPVQVSQHTFGSGVSMEEIQRLQVSWVERQINRVQVQNAYDATLTQGIDDLQSVLGEPSSQGLGAALTDFWNSWEALSVRPTDAALRAQVLEKADHLARTYNLKVQALSDAEARFGEAVTDKVEELNVIVGELAQLNGEVAKAAAAGRPANDLMDQRDRLVGEITRKIGVEVEADGSYLNLKLAGGGPYLVNRTSAFPITVALDEQGEPSGFQMGKAPLTLEGGEIGALLTLRDEISPGLRSDLATWLATVVDQVNNLHSAGYDLRGEPGTNFFEWRGTASHLSLAGSGGITEVEIGPGLESGTHHLTVTSVDAALVPNGMGTVPGAQMSLVQTGGQYTGEPALNVDYHLRVVAPNADPVSLDGLQVQLFKGDEAVGEIQTLSGAGPATATWTGVDGIDFRADFDLGGGAVLPPGARSEGLVTTGILSLDGGPEVPVNLAGQNNLTFVGGDGNGFLAGGSATVNFSGTPFRGTTFTLFGPSGSLGLADGLAGDTGRVAASGSPTAVGDGETARRMGDLATQSIFEATGETASGFLGRTVQALGSRGRESAILEEASGSILLQLQAQRESVSGVNVDEEMVQLIHYQRGFQAAARFLTTVDELIDTLINGVGR